MEFECEALWGWMTELAWKYLRPQAPREINVPTKIRRVLVGLIDKKVCHPGILNQCRNSVEELLSQKDFFDRVGYKLDALCKTDHKKIAIKYRVPTIMFKY